MGITAVTNAGKPIMTTNSVTPKKSDVCVVCFNYTNTVLNKGHYFIHYNQSTVMQDLISKYENDNQIKAGIKKLSLLKTNGKYNAGDIITFYGGYTWGILFKSKITGFK